jgi:hypothetical protein
VHTDRSRDIAESRIQYRGCPAYLDSGGNAPYLIATLHLFATSGDLQMLLEVKCQSSSNSHKRSRYASSRSGLTSTRLGPFVRRDNQRQVCQTSLAHHKGCSDSPRNFGWEGHASPGMLASTSYSWCASLGNIDDHVHKCATRPCSRTSEQLLLQMQKSELTAGAASTAGLRQP